MVWYGELQRNERICAYRLLVGIFCVLIIERERDIYIYYSVEDHRD